MKTNTIMLFQVLFVVLMCSCATTYQYVNLPAQDKTVEDSAMSRIYVMRPAILGSAIQIGVKENDSLIGHTGPKGYLCWETTPDEKILESKSENTSKLSFVPEPGKVYYVHQHVLMGILYARNSLELIADEQQGMKLLSKCKPPVIKSSTK